MTEIKGHTIQLASVRIMVTPAAGVPTTATLGLRPIIIGSDTGCDIIVQDPGVSRRHCALSLTERGILLEDLRSKNGTFIGNVRIMKAILELETLVHIGNAALQARMVGEPSIIPFSPASQFGDALGKTLVMRALFHELEQVAKSAKPILLVGERGTGKRTLAEAIHRASPMSRGWFVVFDPTKGPSEMLPGEGTLYIDGPEELPKSTQFMLASFARGANTYGAHVRVIAGTAQDLDARVAGGAFDAELRQWLATVEIRVPPLRERKDDIRPLAEHFLRMMTPTHHRVPNEQFELLEAHDWPGNVRELREMVELLAVSAHLGQRALLALLGQEAGGAQLLRLLYQKKLDEARDDVVARFEKSYLKLKLEEHRGEVPEIAKAIGVTREHVYRMLRRHGLGGKG